MPRGIRPLLPRGIRPLLRHPVALLGGALLGMAAHAQVNPAAVDRQNQIIERQQQDRLREEQDRAMRALPPPGGTNLQQVKPQVSVPELGAPCRDIREIRSVATPSTCPTTLNAVSRMPTPAAAWAWRTSKPSWPR